jgi:alpha-glucosidase
MMKTRILILAAIFGFLPSCQRDRINEMVVNSPDKKLSFSLCLSSNGELAYSVKKISGVAEKIKIVESSPLGIILSDQSFISSISFQSASPVGVIKEEYELISGKRLKNIAIANQRSFTFKNENGTEMNILVRMFDEGFAFRYIIPRDTNSSYTVIKELTGFHIPANGKAWIEPYDTLQKWGPAHEVGYENAVDIGSKSPKSTGWAFPALFSYNNNWCLLSEADADTTYCASHLEAKCDNGLYKMAFPWAHELYRKGDVTPTGKGSVHTPWRVGIVGSSLKTIVESNLIAHLARPSQIKDMSWIKPGRASWSWWGDVSSPTNVPLLKKYVDFSAQMGWEYTLIDANWHYIPEKEFKELAAYARSKNVGLLLWYNSAGPYTQVYEVGPLDRVHTHELRVREFTRLKELGIKGIKVDFFQSDKQVIMKYYEDLAKDAADFHLLFNAHSATIPRGWYRTYPNFLSAEAVKGAEQYPQKDFTEKAAMWNTILPFTRNVVGPMDYTPVTFSDRGASNSEEPATANKDNTYARHLTTNAHELALSVVFECGIQHFADRATSYLSQPAEVIEFLKDIPVAWDDTYFIDGYPGEFILIARKKNNEVFIGGINGKNTVKTIAFNLSFLPDGEFSLNLITDGRDDRSFDYSRLTIDSKRKVTIKMMPFGGFAGRLKLM